MPIETTGIDPRGAVRDHNVRSLMQSIFAAVRASTSSGAEWGIGLYIPHRLPRLGGLFRENLYDGLQIENVAIAGLQAGYPAGVSLLAQPLLRYSDSPRQSRK